MKSNYCKERLDNQRQLRQDLRIQASFLIELIFNNGRAFFGKVEDLSLNGVKLRLPVSLPTGTQLVLNLISHRLTLKGTCLWTNNPDWAANSYLSGIKFIEITNEQYAGLRQILFNIAG